MIPQKQFIDWLETRGLRPNTIGQYTAWLKNMAKLEKFNQQTVNRFIAKYKTNVARAFLRNYKEFLLRNPDEFKLTDAQVNTIRNIDIPKRKAKKRPTPKPLSLQQILLIEKHMKKEPAKIMLLLSFYCALRVSELLEIRLIDFNWKEWRENQQKPGLLKVKGKGGKVEYIPVKAEIMKRIRTWINSNYKKGEYDKRQVLFPLGVKSPRFKWYDYLRKTSLKAIDVPVNPHMLRHACAMYLRNERGWSIDEVKEFLRHADISTTQIYARVSKEKIMDKYADI